MLWCPGLSGNIYGDALMKVRSENRGEAKRGRKRADTESRKRDDTGSRKRAGSVVRQTVEVKDKA